MVILILIVVGLCLGSFINALVFRLHVLSSPQISKKIKKDLSIIKGRSICPSCQHRLRPLDLIPIISWLALRGKCRYCKKSISAQYPLVELLTPLLFILSYIYWPYRLNLANYFLIATWLMILTCFIALGIYDFKWKLLPNSLVRSVIALALSQFFIKLFFLHGGSNLLLSEVWGVLLSAGIFYIIYLISNGKWIGGGDIKLSIGLGLLIGGPSEAILMLLLASLLGTLISLPFLAMHKLKTNSLIPFGPLLIIATTFCYFFGPNVVAWYQSLTVF